MEIIMQSISKFLVKSIKQVQRVLNTTQSTTSPQAASGSWRFSLSQGWLVMLLPVVLVLTSCGGGIPASDLSISTPSASSSSAVVSTPITFSITVTNEGDAEESNHFTLRVYRSADTNLTPAGDEEVASQGFRGTLAVGASFDISSTITIPAELAPGAYHYYACVDTFGETNTSNNCSSSVEVQVVNTAASAIAAGRNHTCAILSSTGAARCWGNNSYGGLGDGSRTASNTPVQVSGLGSGVTAISAGDKYTCALHSGAAKCWGDNDIGKLGNGSTTRSLIPVDVTGLGSGVTAISAGIFWHTCAIHNGAAKCWGRNHVGQLGDGSTDNSNLPVQVTGLTSGVTAVSAGSIHTCAVHNGAAKCWGYNFYGRLGDDSTDNSNLPVDVTGLHSGVTAISAGQFHTCALHNGAAKCWGRNRYGELGDGTETIDYDDPDTPGDERVDNGRLTPGQVTGLTSGVTAISAGWSYNCALHNGAAKCWGFDGEGQLGDGISITGHNVPIQVSGLTSGGTAISAGWQHTCALHSGVAKCWGWNAIGQLGVGELPDTDSDGTPDDYSLTPVPVLFYIVARPDLQLEDPAVSHDAILGNRELTVSVGVRNTGDLTAASGGTIAYYRSTDDTISNGDTRLGSATLPTISSGDSTDRISFDTPSPDTAGTYYYGACVSHDDDSKNSNDCSAAVKVLVVNAATAISAGYQHTCAIIHGRNAKCWGRNGSGRLGNGSSTNSSTPVAFSGQTDRVNFISAGRFHTCASMGSGGGAAWCWGYNSNGQLGNGNYSIHNRPVHVIGIRRQFTKVSAGRAHTCGIWHGGTWCWGSNAYGRVGNGGGTDRRYNILQPVAGLGSGVTDISAGRWHTCAVQDGVARCWGRNQKGQLGIGRSITQHITQLTVEGLTRNVTAISAGAAYTCAIHSGGAKCWGGNFYGQLGDGSTDNSNLPVRVSGLSSGVTAISAGGLHTCAIHGGAAKCWGLNGSGRLGDGSTTERHTAVQVSGLVSGVTAISAGDSHTCAVHSGIAKCWGSNGDGQLGDGNTTRSKTPVPVLLIE